ncbi:polysaccharide biosynthesis C-terminal domain-containing protein [Thalassococcus sp. CAU 1522]|uniref:Polysaccharide biosynthesis C-terminal domain-containing protein n=1 Tax=Thalassococcus arenae TaxID=2851652 RepID=A0ABS6ND77_9RHOB|nr:MATE family efflux transporter [Thalassococcus arenae]MBV2361554.1 polysaccharide biosynthesis C-terminal domain-containing protein [Thalassococcus arenae]
MSFQSNAPDLEADGGPTARAVFTLAWPMTLKAVFLFGTVVIDGYLVSALGEAALAAMGLAATTAGFVLGVVFAFSNAMQIRTAQVFGTRNPVLMKSALASGLVVSLALGAVGLALLAVFGRGFLNAMAPSADVAELAWSYLTIFSLVILGEAVSQCLSSYFNGCGRTRLPLYGYCLSVPINVVASVVLIHGLWGLPAFGVAGAAMGSAIAIGIQALFLVSQLRRLDGHLRGVAGWHKAGFLQALKWHVVFSLPIAATFISANFANHVCALIFARLSLNEFAAMTLIMPWIMVAGTFGMQWAQATGIIVAQLLGQGRPEPVLDRFLASAWRGAFVAAAAVASVYAVVCLSAAAIYTDLDAETVTILAGFLPVLLVLPFPKGSNAICGNTLRASGDTVHVMHIFLWSQWLFRVPVTALAVIYLDWAAVWVLSIMLWEELVKFPAFHRRLLRGDWKRSEVAG